MASRTDARGAHLRRVGRRGGAARRRGRAPPPALPAVLPWGTVDVRLAVHGVHQVGNALAAAAAALVQDVPLEAVAEGLASAGLSPWRMELGHTPSGAVVLNDAYNSNPTALAAALHSLVALDADRHVAVLGVMAELGHRSDERHAEMGELADDLGIDVITVDVPGLRRRHRRPDGGGRGGRARCARCAGCGAREGEPVGRARAGRGPAGGLIVRSRRGRPAPARWRGPAGTSPPSPS